MEEFVEVSQHFPFSLSNRSFVRSFSLFFRSWRKQVIWLDFEPIRHHCIRFLYSGAHTFMERPHIVCWYTFYTNLTHASRINHRKIVAHFVTWTLSGNPSASAHTQHIHYIYVRIDICILLCEYGRLCVHTNRNGDGDGDVEMGWIGFLLSSYNANDKKGNKVNGIMVAENVKTHKRVLNYTNFFFISLA